MKLYVKSMIVETSIIVRAFNEEKHLGNLFDGFDRQTYRDFEVIVVDSGSFDRSREIAEERADKLIRINSHLKQPICGLGHCT